MHVNTQIDRGLERVIASNEAARLEGLFGLSGEFGMVETFDGLAGLVDDVGIVGGKDLVENCRRRHKVIGERMKAAVPVARDAMRLMDEYDGDLAGIFSKIKKAVKKVTKVALKLSPTHAVLKKVAPKIAAGTPMARFANSSPKMPPKTAEQIAAAAQKKADKAAAKQAAKDAKAAAKQAKKDAKAAAALAAAQVKSGTPTVDAGAAVLANQSGVNLTSDQAALLAQQVASNIQQPGSTVPTASMFANQPPSSGGEMAPAESGAGPFGLSTPVLIGGVVALAGIGYLAFKKKGRR